MFKVLDVEQLLHKIWSEESKSKVTADGIILYLTFLIVTFSCVLTIYQIFPNVQIQRNPTFCGHFDFFGLKKCILTWKLFILWFALFCLFVFFLLPQARDVSKAVWNMCTSLILFNLPALTQHYHSVVFPSWGIYKIIVFETLHKFILNLSCNVVFLPSSGGQLFLLGYFSSCLLVFHLWAGNTGCNRTAYSVTLVWTVSIRCNAKL